MDEPKILSNEELEKITLEELEKNRVLMRDLEYTLNEFFTKKEVPAMVKEKRGGHCWFALPDDDHLYFFDDGWPIEYDDFLRPEDIIPSGHWHQKSRSEAEIKQLAKGLKMSVKRFWEEEYYCNPDVLGAIGVERAPFTKPLERTNRNFGKRERFSHRQGKWEAC
jgi:hypothetical protein